MGRSGVGAEFAVAAVGVAGVLSGVGIRGLWVVDGSGTSTRVVVALTAHSLAGAGDCALWNGVRVSLDLHGEGLEGVV